MEVVINSCFGGFGVSSKALVWLRERGYEPTMWPNEVMNGEEWENGEVCTDDYDSFRLELGKRNDDLLVECVKTLGRMASGPLSVLKVVEIPDGVDYVISEYDGLETIEEAHRSWN